MTRRLAAVIATVCAGAALTACGTTSNPTYGVGDCLDRKPAAVAKGDGDPGKVPCASGKARSKLVGTGAPAACQGSERTLEDPGDRNIAYCVRAR